MSDNGAPTIPATASGGAQDPGIANQVVGTPAPTGAAQPGDVASAAKEAARKMRIDNDDVDEAEVIKIYKERKGHQKAASRELNEGKALRKQAEEVIAMIKDPDRVWEVIEKLGHDSRSLAEKRLSAALEDELMDPKDKRLRDLESQLKRREEQERAEKESIEKKIMEKRTEALRLQYEKEFIEVLEKSKLPKTKNTVGRMAAYVHRGAQFKEPITPQEAAQLVEQDLRNEHSQMTMDSDIESLIKVYGDDFFNKLRKYDTSKLKNPESVLHTPKNQDIDVKGRERPKKVKQMTQKEWTLMKRGLK